jgi:LAO/AO transport system kinase
MLEGDRRSLARAITLADRRADHRAEAEALLAEVLPHTGGATRIGISRRAGRARARSSRRSGVT